MKGLEKLYEKFISKESDEIAEKMFLDLITESVDALFSVIFDRMHIWAGYWK